MRTRRLRIRFASLAGVSMLLVLVACESGTDPAGPDPAAPVAAIEVSPARGWLLTGDTVRLEVVLRDDEGRELPDREVSFQSSDPELAPVSSSGLVQVLDTGAVGVAVTSGGTSVEATFELKLGSGLRVPALQVVDSLIVDLIERYDVPGAAVGVTRDERLVLLRGYGLADREADEPMTPDHRFRVASLSKALAAFSALELVDRGLLGLDDAVFELLDHLEPLPDATPDPRLADIRVRHLIRHTGGWDRGESGDWTYPPYVRYAADDLGIPGPPNPEELIRWIMGRPLDFDPGAQYAYSNVGYMALARVVEAVTGREYEEFVRNELLLPAGATRMQVGETFLEDRLDGEVRYHDSPMVESVYPDRGTVEQAYGGFSVPARDGQGGWVASPADYLRFLHAVDGRPGRPDVVGSGVVEWVNTRPDGPVFEFANSWYSGFSVRPQAGDYFWSHGGSLPGTRALVIHRPDGVSYVMLFNARAGGDFSSEIGSILGGPLRAVPDTAWPEHDLFDVHP